MSEYTYRGFKICYQIKKDPGTQLYKADGFIVSTMDDGEKIDSKFHTEALSNKKAENEIKKIIEKFIDFEWHEYIECCDLPENNLSK
ncbi:hypothetical protein [Legionella fairfieldensis]|uniref:hypothetical protein n=1 Tax=Legionella fairfieldensis TaxID=45064 RepID=UPI00048FDC86|nr:hypothetical protein [Legionella fairfieldensis]